MNCFDGVFGVNIVIFAIFILTYVLIASRRLSLVPIGRPAGALLGSLEQGWILLAFTTTVAGNFTLTGSVANIIVAETAREHYSLGFFEYLCFGIVSTILVLGFGVVIIHFVII